MVNPGTSGLTSPGACRPPDPALSFGVSAPQTPRSLSGSPPRRPLRLGGREQNQKWPGVRQPLPGIWLRCQILNRDASQCAPRSVYQCQDGGDDDEATASHACEHAGMLAHLGPGLRDPGVAIHLKTTPPPGP